MTGFQNTSEMAFDAFYEQTFDLLIEKTVELERALRQYRNSKGETETLKFYESVAKTMKLAWNTFLDFKQHYYDMEHIRMENEYLRDRCRRIQAELDKYKMVEYLKLTGEMDDISAHIDKIIEKKELLSLKSDQEKK